MKKLLLAMTLAGAAACASPGPGLVPIEAEGPVARTIERVLSRTEAYMAMPEGERPVPVSAQVEGQVTAAIEVARAMALLPAASGDMLAVTMSSVMGMHDVLVQHDASLDQLEREIYLEDSARLRSLFDAVSIHELVPAN